MKRLNTKDCNKSFLGRSGVLCVLLFIAAVNLFAQDNPITLYVSAQTKQATSFSGNYNAQTDSFSYGHITLSATGPLIYTTDQNDLVAPRSQNVSWGGKISVNMNAIPTPGTTEPAAILGAYSVGYSRAYGTGTEGKVVSTYYCNGQCAVHNGVKGIHEIVTDTGVQSLSFNVVSIMADLPDTTIIATSGVQGSSIAQQVTVACYPAQGGNFKWTCSDPAVKLTNTTQQTVTVALRTTANTNPVLHVTFEIGGVSYSAQTVLKSGACSCTSFNNLLVVDKLSINMNDDRHKNITSADTANCTYTVQAPAFSMNMNGVITRQLVVNTGNASVKFKKECNNTYKNIELTWEGNAALSGIKIGNTENAIQLTATRTHLYKNESGALSGDMTIHAIIKDLDLSGDGTIIIKKTEGDITYDAIKGYDFSGLKDIEIDLVKKNSGNADVVVGTYKGAMKANGDFAGVITATGNPYVSNSFALALTDMKQDFVLHAASGVFTQGKASGTITVSGVQGLTGSASFRFDINEGGGITTTSNSGSFTAFDMKLSNLDLKADFNRNFDLFSIAGKAIAKHEEFDAPLTVEYLRADDGALTSFNASGKVVYHGFTLLLQRSVYSKTDGLLNISTNVELNLAETGKKEVVSMSKLNISHSGKITVGSIQGSITHNPAELDFTASYTNDGGFAGDFHGTYGSLPVSGTIAIHSGDNYNYAQLALRNQQRMPLGSSGLYLTDMNGAMGLNYEISNPADNTGTPHQGSYVLALKTTVQDEAGLINATGGGIIPFGTDPVLGIKGMVQSQTENPAFKGNVAIDYHLNQQSVEGSLTSNINLGLAHHFLSTGNCNIHFTICNEKWTAAGNDVSGKIFNDKLQIENSAIDMSGNLQQPNVLTGNIRGTLKGDYLYTVNFPINDAQNGGTVSGTITFTLNAPINAPINQDGLSGSFPATLHGNDSLTLDIPSMGFHQTYLSTATANGQIANNNGNISFQGTMDIVLGKFKYTKPLNISF